MWIGKVVGNIVATRKDDTLIGCKLLIVRPIGEHNSNRLVVSVDTVGAGNGETVLVVDGSSARHVIEKANAAVDSAIIGIVDTMEIDEELMTDEG